MLQFSSLISSQIRFLVESVNDANYDSIYRELRQVWSRFVWSFSVFVVETFNSCFLDKNMVIKGTVMHAFGKKILILSGIKNLSWWGHQLVYSWVILSSILVMELVWWWCWVCEDFRRHNVGSFGCSMFLNFGEFWIL